MKKAKRGKIPKSIYHRDKTEKNNPLINVILNNK